AEPAKRLLARTVLRQSRLAFRPMLHLSIEPLSEDGAALPYRGPRGLHQSGEQPLVGAFDRSALLFARRSIVSGGDASPTGEMAWAGKLRHIPSSFGQDHGGGFGGDAGDGLQQLILSFEGLKFLQGPLAEFGELFFK